MTSIHYPGSGREEHVSADRLAAEKASGAADALCWAGWGGVLDLGNDLIVVDV